MEYDRARAMKQTDFRPCANCGKGVMHGGVPVFYRVTVEQMGVDGKAVQRHVGLEQMLGGNALIANAMGEDADIGIPISEVFIGLLCLTCAGDPNISMCQLFCAMIDQRKTEQS
jgi:hypothetical protein